MRLIDAHKVQMKLFEECQNIRYFDKDRKKSQIFADGLDFAWVMLDNQPTVEAIPIEWINHYLKELKEEIELDSDYSAYCGIAEMKKCWERENETNRC